MTRLRRQSVLLFWLCLTPTIATAQFASTDVPVEDVTYRYLAQLQSLGCLPEYNANQRPLLRSEVARLIQQCDNHMLSPSHVAHKYQHIISRILRWYRQANRDMAHSAGFHIQPIDSLTFTTSALSAMPRAVNGDNGAGILDTTVSPLTVNRAGRTIGYGTQTSYESLHRARFSRYAALSVRPRYVLNDRLTTNVTSHVDVALYEAQLKGQIAGLELAVGRGQIAWGPAGAGGLIFSTNAPPLDMIRLSTPHGFYLPWVFRHIGPIRATMMFAHMGKGSAPANAILSGYRVDFQPKSWIRFGINHGVIMGGVGSEDPSVLEAIWEYTGIAGAFSPGRGRTDSNHIFGADLAVRIPQWRGLEIYGVHAFDDPDKALEIQFDQEAAWIGGIFLPRLSRDGQWSLRGEYLRTGPGMYRHGHFISGWVHRRILLGAPYGGDSNAGKIMIRFNNPNRIEGDGSVVFVQRSNDTYSTINDSAGDRIAFVQNANFPEEYTLVAAGKISIPLQAWLTLRVEAGYEHVWNNGFRSGAHGNHVFTGVGLRFAFGQQQKPKLAHAEKVLQQAPIAAKEAVK
jgi:hypothetical protein